MPDPRPDPALLQRIPDVLHELRPAPDEPAKRARREPPDPRDVRAERASVDAQRVQLLVEHVLRHAVEEQVHGEDDDDEVVEPADERTPVSKKAMLGAALGYVALGRDIVPAKVPILGQLDDLVVVALAIELFLEGLEEDLLAEKLQEAGIPRAAYDEDVARVRRFIPGPIRRTVGRIPGAVRTAADAVAQSGLPPRLRSWIERA